MKIGILFCSYSTPQYLLGALWPWAVARRDKLGGHSYVISAVSLPFAEYKDIPDTRLDNVTPAELTKYLDAGFIDYLVTEPQFQSEAAARTAALKHLLFEGCDLIWLADGDEYITADQILAILAFTETQPLLTWFKLSLVNYVFDEKTHLVDPFTPPRLFRAKSGGYVLDSFRWDNDAVYKGTITRDFRLNQDGWSHMTIPASVAAIKHFTWMNTEASRLKILYQEKHFGGVCSFAWDDARGGLVFRESYYKALGQPLPEIARDQA